jgi:hypothetical protein
MERKAPARQLSLGIVEAEASPFHPTSVERPSRSARRSGSLIRQALCLDQEDAYAAGEVGFPARALVQALQFGSGYANPRHFKKRFLGYLRDVIAYYPEVRIETSAAALVSGRRRRTWRHDRRADEGELKSSRSRFHLLSSGCTEGRSPQGATVECSRVTVLARHVLPAPQRQEEQGYGSLV